MENDTFTIDITPVGMKTPAGIARVEEAQREWEASHATVANATHRFLQDYGSVLISALQDLDEDDASDAIEILEAIQSDCRRMVRLQETFLRAVAGR